MHLITIMTNKQFHNVLILYEQKHFLASTGQFFNQPLKALTNV